MEEWHSSLSTWFIATWTKKKTWSGIGHFFGCKKWVTIDIDYKLLFVDYKLLKGRGYGKNGSMIGRDPLLLLQQSLQHIMAEIKSGHRHAKSRPVLSTRQ